MSKDSAEKLDLSYCSAVLAAIAETKAEIQSAFDEANKLHQTERNQSFYEGQHHAYKYAFLVLGQLEWKIVSKLEQ